MEEDIKDGGFLEKIRKRNVIKLARDFLKDMYANTTIEPVILILSLMWGFTYLSGSQLYVDKMCRVNLVIDGVINATNSKEICDNIYSNKTLQTENQERVTRLQTLSKCVQAIPPLIYALIAGPWCDKHGRKPLILISLFGYVLSSAIFVINTIWYHELRAEYLILECLQGKRAYELIYQVYLSFYIVSSVKCFCTEVFLIILSKYCRCYWWQHHIIPWHIFLSDRCDNT